MQKGDVRAVENPITAIFDLAEDVEAQSPKIRIAIQYARIFITFALLLNALVIVVVAQANAFALLLTLLVLFLMFVRRWIRDAPGRAVFLGLALVSGALLLVTFGGGLLLGAILVPFFFLGLITLGYLREIGEFFDYYALRHRVVKSVRDADPVAVVPDGKDPTQRLLAYLGSRNPEVQQVLRTPRGTMAPALLHGKSGMRYSFDAALRREPSPLWTVAGIGSPGFGVFVKAFPAPPSRKDLEAVKRAVEDVSLATRIPPTRVIAVWRSSGDAHLADDAYEFLTREVVRVTILGKEFTCSLQSIEENPDGTYDFIPFIPEAMPGTASAGAPRPA